MALKHAHNFGLSLGSILRFALPGHLIRGGRGHGRNGRLGVVWRQTAAKKGADFLGALLLERTACLRRLGRDRAGTVAFGRFLNNEAVSLETILATAVRHTAEAARGRHVLALQDTTELNFWRHAGSKKGFGVVGNGRDIGLFLHPVIVIEAGDGDPRQVGHAGGVLGLADANFYTRAKAPPGGRKSREKQRRIPRAIETKETGRWVEGLVQADRRLREAAMVSVIADRESDFYELFAKPRSAHVHLIVRAAHNRHMSDGARLMAAMAAAPHVAGQDIFIPAKDGRAARRARTRVSWREIELPRPRVGFELDRLPASVKLNAVMVEEIDAPEGVKPIVWVLLTTHAVESLEDALRIVGWYRARWTIDIDPAWRLSRINGGSRRLRFWRQAAPGRRRCADRFQRGDGLRIGEHQFVALGAPSVAA